MDNTTKIVDKMFNNDPFSQWLGIKRLQDKKGNVTLSLTIRPDMLNGFDIAHGGISYALADSALAFSANSHGQQAVSLETSISHTKPLKKGDTITTNIEEISLTRKTGIYQIKIVNQHKELVAFFKGTVYRSTKEWDV